MSSSRHLVHRSIVGAAFGLIIVAALPGRAGTFNNVDVVGLWSNPVLTGSLYSVDPVTYVVTTQQADNTATAVYSPLGTNTIQWGSGAFPAPNSSSVVFVGTHYQTLPLNVLTELGTLTYLNGESDLPSLIFGATLTLSVPNTNVDLLDAHLGINTTTNSGTCEQCDADFISFLPPIQLNQTANVFERQSAMFTLYGEFVGDPTIELRNLVLVPGQTGGFVGEGPGTPEPGTFGVLGGALAAIAFVRLRRRNRNGVTANKV